MISTKNLALPAPDDLTRVCQSIAMLDAILMPEWELRYYSFDAGWGDGEMMASMKNGSGDHYFILCSPRGTIIKGFDHTSQMGRYATKFGRPCPGVLDQLPKEFEDFLREPAFITAETSFCIWQRNEDTSWRTGDIEFPEGEDPDGSKNLLYILDGNPETYQRWGEQYYERPVRLDLVRDIYDHAPLTDGLVSGLNPVVSIADLSEDIKEIAYP